MYTWTPSDAQAHTPHCLADTHMHTPSTNTHAFARGLDTPKSQARVYVHVCVCTPAHQPQLHPHSEGHMDSHIGRQGPPETHPTYRPTRTLTHSHTETSSSSPVGWLPQKRAGKFVCCQRRGLDIP